MSPTTQSPDVRRALLERLLKEKLQRERTFPLSFAQERLWFAEQLDPGSAVYNVPAVVRLSGPVDAAVLGRALNEVVRRHESLRTVFRDVDGRPVQAVLPTRELPLRVLDLASGADAEACAQQIAANDAREPFDLAAGPLLRASLLRVAADEHVLLLTMHHIISDGWSMGVLFRELAALYQAFAAGAASPLAEPALQYADYAVWQCEHLTGKALERQVTYWKRRLAGAPALLELPTDRPRPMAESHVGERHVFALPAGLEAELRALARGEGATLFMVLLAAFKAVLARYTGQDDVVVGSPIAGRTRGEFEGLVGFFVNTLALRTDLGGDPTFRQLLQRVREGTFEAYQHQDLPFEKLVEEVQVERTLAYHPVFQVMFGLQNASGAPLQLPGVQSRVEYAHSGVARFDLTFWVDEGDDGLTASFEYATDLFDDATIEHLGRHFAALLTAAVAAPDAPVSRLPLLDDAERAMVVDEWNRTASDFPRDRSMVSLFAEQAAATPDAIAVTYGDASLTYAELDRASNRLARRLRALGVAADSRVALS
ncbi:MAG TPA: condensation domain-containing protein, partial [Longimicrobium sp.]|nr:condensation domain-containing protein [Longimicrobium sp.]